MCYYIMATLPKGTKLKALMPVFASYEMIFSPVNNEHIQSATIRGIVF